MKTIEFRVKHPRLGWAYFTLDQLLVRDEVIPEWVYENPQLPKDRGVGSTDAYGVAIYERDIIVRKSAPKKRLIVFYDATDGLAGWYANETGKRYDESGRVLPSLGLAAYPAYEFKKVGSVHD